MFKIKLQPNEVKFCKRCVASNQKPCPSDEKKTIFYIQLRNFLDLKTEYVLLV